jgi:hypothetical protein
MRRIAWGSKYVFQVHNISNVCAIGRFRHGPLNGSLLAYPLNTNSSTGLRILVRLLCLQSFGYSLALVLRDMR